MGTPAPIVADMAALTNQALLDILQQWQQVIWVLGELCAIEHTHFQDVMIELGLRNMVDMSWCWIVDFHTIDMNYTRV